MFGRDRTNAARFAPDLLADADIVRIGRLFALWTTVTLVAPALLGGLITMSWWGALTAFLWAGPVRIAVLHHVTWSINSICHMVGHADPTCARHGVERGQVDISARVIRVLEKLGWATGVRWPTPARLARLQSRPVR